MAGSVVTDGYIVLPVPQSRIAHEWKTISDHILPSIKDGMTEMELFGRLVSGNMQAIRIHSFRADATAVLRVDTDENRLVCWIGYLGGKHRGGPKAFTNLVRSVVAAIEDKAKDIGCKEVRLGGRFWGNVLTDYEPYSGISNGLRKAI